MLLIFPKPLEGFKLKGDVFNFVLKDYLLYRQWNVDQQCEWNHEELLEGYEDYPE